MSTPRHTPLSLRTQLVALANELHSSDSNDYFANDRSAQQLSKFKSGLERDGFKDVAEQAAVAVRLAEFLQSGETLKAEQAHELLELLVKSIATAIGVELPTPEPPAATPRTDAPPAVPAPRPNELRLSSNRKLGEILVQMSLLTPSQVEQALAHQRMTGCRLGEALVEMRILSKSTVESALRGQGLRRGNDYSDPWRAVS
jgi:hypothetical protein